MNTTSGPRSRGSGSVFLRGTVWWIKYHRHGRPFRESAKTEDIHRAERLLKRRLAEIEMGQFQGPNLERIRFEDLATDLENDYKINERKSAARCSWSVQHLNGFFSGYRAVEITTDRIRSYVARRREEGAANATINRELAALKRMFNLAAEMTPPKVAHVPHIPMLREAAPRKGFVEQGTFVKLRIAVPEYLRPVVTMAYYTGMRASEVLSLRWEQVNLQDRLLQLAPGTTKNDAARTIPLAGDLFECMAMQKAIRDSSFPDCPWVFCRAGKPIRSFRTAWANATEAIGQPNLLFHDLRRSGVRNLVRAGVPERVAMAISGHKTRSVFDRYNIVSDRDLKDAARKLDEFLQFGHSLGTIAQNECNPADSEIPLSPVN